MTFLDNDYIFKSKEFRYRLKVVGYAFDGDLFIEVKNEDSITYRKDTRSFVKMFSREIENGDIAMVECNQVLEKSNKPHPRTCAICGIGPCSKMLNDIANQLTGVNNKDKYTQEEIDKIAKVCQEVNREYCISIGDDSQYTWEDAPDWQKETVRLGVLFHLNNPDAVASDSHDEWLKVKRKEGWSYGPVKDPVKKQHPCYVIYEDLPKEQQIKDHLFMAVVKAMRK